MSSPPRARRSPVVVAYLIVYLVWGSTYLAIREAIVTLPPLGMAGVRFLVAGGLLYTFGRVRGAPRPTMRQWRLSLVVGALLLLGGNGSVVLAERRVSSGIAALLIATEPLCIVLLAWVFPNGRRPSLRTVLGMASGIAGVVVLVGSRSGFGGTRVDLVGSGLVLVGALSWALGSLVASGTAPEERLSSTMASGTQMLCGGALLLVVSILVGEPSTFHAAQVSGRSLFAFAYLIVLGSLVAFSAYAWLVQVEPPQRVATYAFVNPAVAVLVGWAIAGEPVTWATLGAGVLITLAVMFTVLQKAESR